MAGEKKFKQILAQRPFRSILIKPKVYKALTVAGSDPSGGAGIQADLKTFTAFEVYGSAIITAITAQNTTRVGRISSVDSVLITEQLDLVIEDLGCQPMKTGMLPNCGTIKAVIEGIGRHGLKEVIVDPVLAASNADSLVTENTLGALQELIGKSLLVTPNLDEAKALTGVEAQSPDGMKEAALRIYQMGARNVLIKGGHLLNDATDLLFDGKEFTLLKEKKIPLGKTHGTGCSYSAAITAGLAKGMPLLDAIINAKIFITRALKFAMEVGHGSKVLNYFV